MNQVKCVFSIGKLSNNLEVRKHNVFKKSKRGTPIGDLILSLIERQLLLVIIKGLVRVVHFHEVIFFFIKKFKLKSESKKQQK